MKIIFLEAVQNFGGARKSTLELAKRIQSLGHQVLIVDFWGCCQPFNEATKSFQLEMKVLDRREEPFIIKSGSKLKYFCNAIQYFFLQKSYKSTFAKIVREFQPDVVSINNTKCLNILSPESSYTIDFFARIWFDYRSISFFDKKMLKKYKPRFLTVSQATRQAIFTGGIADMENIKVLTSVIKSDVFEDFQLNFPTFFSAEKPINILFSGGFLKTKGQHTCVAIAQKLKEINIPFKMYLTGIIYKGEESEKYYNNILNTIDKYDLKQHIEIVLNPPNIMDYFKMCDVLIHPSWTEGLPRVALEALSFGKPIIANPVGGVTDVVIHNLTGFVADFNDVEQYAEYIARYVRNPELYKLHSITARQLIKQNYLDANQFESIKNIYPI